MRQIVHFSFSQTDDCYTWPEEDSHSISERRNPLILPVAENILVIV
jgi:hypothetical protein